MLLIWFRYLHCRLYFIPICCILFCCCDLDWGVHMALHIA